MLNTLLLYFTLYFYLVSLDVFSKNQRARARYIRLSLEYDYSHNGILLLSTLPRHMSSKDIVTPSILLEAYSTIRLEALLNSITEPYSDIIWNAFE